MSNTNIKAVIFDMDGVLIDSEPLHFRADQELFKKFGKIFSEKEQVEFTGRTVYEQLISLIDRWGISNEPEELLESRREIFENLIKMEGKMLPGVKELLEFLDKSEISIGLGTSAEQWYADLVLELFSIEKFFKTTVTAKDVKNGKPEPDIYLAAAVGLGKEPAQCLVLEDAPLGLLAAKNAGMRCYIVPSQYTQGMDFSTADKIFNNLMEVKDDLESLLAI